MEKSSFITIFTCIGLAIGGGISFYFGFNIVVGTIVCSVFSTIFGLLAYYLNSIGILISFFQIINLLIGLFLYYGLFVFICALIVQQTSLNENAQNNIIGIVPIPFAIIMIIRYIKKKKIKFTRETIDE